MLTETVISGRTAAGCPAEVTIRVEEPDPIWETSPAPLVIGATVKSADFARLAAGGPLRGARFTRTFSADGEGVLPPQHPRRRVPVGVCEFHSIADWLGDDAMIDAVCDLLDDLDPRLITEAPLLPELRPYDPDGYTPDKAPESDGFSFLLTWCHEYEHKMIAKGVPPRELRRRHRLLYRTVRRHPRGFRVGYMSIQNLYWTRAKSGTKSSPGPVKGDGDIFAWWAGVGDYAAVDAYAASITDQPAGPELYEDPDKLLGLCWQLAAGTGRRLFLPEVGVILQGQPADPGNYRAAWIRRLVANLAAGGAAAVAWWDAPGANDRDFRLADPQSAEAWAEAIAAGRR